MYAILGPSGCGKTTLLSLLGGLDSPTSGNILFEGKDVAQAGLAAHRKKSVSFIFQNYNLIDYMTPQENVRLISKKQALPFLERLGLTKEEIKRNVLKLSGGQQQRVLLARALCATKKLLLLDEPVTGLDPIVTAEFYQLISRINKESGIAVVMVSHDIESAVEYASHILHLQETVLYFGKADGYEKSRAGKTFLGGETHV